jgi:hypothetical protein
VGSSEIAGGAAAGYAARPGAAVPRTPRQNRTSFLREHSLSLVLVGLVLLLLALYVPSDPQTHLGTFYGNAIADWLGVLVFVVATKYFFEIGSGESRRPVKQLHLRLGRFLQTHSLTIVLVVTAIPWTIAYFRSDVDSKAGQVFGNIVSDWTQVVGLVVLTKYTKEQGSKEGK